MWSDNVNAKFVIEQYATIQGHANVLNKFCRELMECYEGADNYDTRCLELRGKTTEVIRNLIKELNNVLEREREWSHSLFSFTKSTICYVDYNLKTYYVMVHVATNFGVIEAEAYLMDDSFAGDDLLSMLLTRKPIRQRGKSRESYSHKAARAAMKDMQDEGWVKRRK